MKSHEIYRRFCIETEKFETPPRYGYDWFASALDKVWQRGSSAQMDWGGFEQFMRDVLRSERLDDAQKLTMINEGIGAFTGRGCPIQNSEGEQDGSQREGDPRVGREE